MIISIEKLTKAIEKVKSFADSTQNVPGVLFDIRGDELRVCYSDGKKSIIEKIDVTTEDGDVSGKIVVGYNRILSIIDMCKPSGEIRTDDIKVSFLEGNVMNIEIVKTMLVQRNTGNTDEEGNALYVEESKVVSKFNQMLNYNYISDNLRFGILDRMNYDDIFVDENGDGSEDANFDTWDKEELKEILNKSSAEKGRTVYVSSKVKGAFVVNAAYVIFIPTDSCSDNGFAISTMMAKSIVEILNKIDEDQVRVCKKDRYVSIVNGIDTVGIWMEMSPASKTDLATLNLYSNKQYETFELVFSRAALMNVISCASNMTKDEKTTITFKQVDGAKSLVISGKDTGDFNVTIEGNQDNIKNWEMLKETTLPMSMKILNAMLGDCSTTYVSIDILADDTGKYVRVSELFGRDEAGEKVLGATHYTIASK